jgi:hypothetical protein
LASHPVRPVALVTLLLLVVAALVAPVRAARADTGTMYALVDQARAENGLGGLRRNAGLAAAAQAWAEQMAATGTLAHNPDYLSQIPAGWARAGENVGWAGSDEELIGAFMASPGHRANILGDYTDVGIGRAVDAAGVVWEAQEFGNYPAPAPPPPAPVATVPATQEPDPPVASRPADDPPDDTPHDAPNDTPSDAPPTAAAAPESAAAPTDPPVVASPLTEPPALALFAAPFATPFALLIRAVPALVQSAEQSSDAIVIRATEAVQAVQLAGPPRWGEGLAPRPLVQLVVQALTRLSAQLSAWSAWAAGR